ncbi:MULTISPECIES: CopG family transcriptional regulator [unclassified Massilia]|uniref:CopG family transcriptional regulator n=1 Tax=unclassified Massilia TaxID=2609279 RepID=UPI002105BE16|nr:MULTISPECIES: CopG family transcriptional regulator [unclassified Massilia]UTY55988.1 CopG family transcriptional regulator [Massilia sp. erpn]
MPTTTIQLPQDLQARIAKVAERLGKTPQSFILEAIAEKADQEELRADFDAEADARFARILSSGETIPWADMRRYIEDRAQGKQATAPKPKKQA